MHLCTLSGRVFLCSATGSISRRSHRHCAASLLPIQAVYCCAIVASSQDLAFVYAIAWTALNLLVNPYMAMFNLYSLGWGFSWLRFFSPFNYAWQVRAPCSYSCSWQLEVSARIMLIVADVTVAMHR